MNTAMLTPLPGETPERTVDLEALARHLESIRGRIVLIMCPHGTGWDGSEADQRHYTLQAEAYKTCAASLAAAASAIRTFQAQQEL